MPDGEGRKGAERPLRVAVRGTGRQPGEKRARRPRPTDRDVVAGAVHGPHGHAGPAEAALVHVAGHRASQAGEAEQPAAACEGGRTVGTRPEPPPPARPRRHSQTLQSVQQSISPVCHIGLALVTTATAWGCRVTTVGTAIVESRAARGGGGGQEGSASQDPRVPTPPLAPKPQRAPRRAKQSPWHRATDGTRSREPLPGAALTSVHRRRGGRK